MAQANNLIQIKRTSISGRAANTTTLPNPGELALNMTDGILYSGNGSVVFEIGANNTNVNISGNLAVKAIIANNSIGAYGQVLYSSGSDVYWGPGASGFTGSRGDTGFTGSFGTTGFTGSVGYVGSKGDLGYVGSQGDIGYTGSQGVGFTGSVGYAGSQGDLGYTGSAGSDGSIGYNGSVGYVGSQGNAGYTGSQGDLGEIGPVGYTGSRGDLGYTGSQGVGFAGSVGYAGSQGDLGYTGSQGVGFTGSVGYAGSQGDLGYTGSQGPQGSFGGATFDYTFNANTNNSDPTNGNLKLSNTDLTLANTLYISENADNFQSIYTFLQTIDDSTSAIKGHFTVTEKANTSNFVLYAITGLHAHYTNYFAVPTSYLNGSANNFTNNLDIIITFARTGDIGDTGYTGSTGFVGSQGELGYTGSVGDTGYTGSFGSIGYTGSLGYTGSKGDLGYTGSVGSGFVGSAGYLGSTGFVGSKGDLGFTGSIGFTGSAATSSFTNGQSISINNLISTGQIYVGNGVVNTVITDTSITTPLLNFTTNTSISTFSTELDATTPKTVTFGNVPLNSATANGYTVEFFVKFKTLPTSGMSGFAGTTVSQIGLEANTSAMRIVNNGFTVAGDVVYRTFENNVWYHFAYIGQSNNTYIAIDGQVTNLNNIGGYSGYSATGTWNSGWTRLSGNAVFSNFRVVTNQGGNVYDINGFTPPGSPLTAIANTKILTLIGNTFVDASGTNTTVTTAGSPTLINDTIVNDGQSITTTIDGTTLSVSNIYTNFLYANNAAGNTGQLLAANSTGGIFWTNVIGYTGSRGTDGIVGYNGSVGFVGSQGDLGYTGSQGAAGTPGGYTGSQGAAGYVGSQGDLGYTGSQGAGFSGSVGFTGSTGVGYTGSSGVSLPRVNTATSTATLTWNSDTYEQYQLTAMAAGVTVSADSGTPSNGQKIVFRFKDNGTARSISLTTGTSKSFRAIGTTLPTTTVISKTLYVGAIYNSADNRWDVVATAQEA